MCLTHEQSLLLDCLLLINVTDKTAMTVLCCLTTRQRLARFCERWLAAPRMGERELLRAALEISEAV